MGARRLGLILVIGVGLGGCGASSKALSEGGDASGPDGSDNETAGPGAAGAGGGEPDGSSQNDDAGGGQAGTTNDGGSPDADAAGDGPGFEAPPALGPHLVVAGRAIQLVGSGENTCTNQSPYGTDRWCAFTKPGALVGTDQLWVINASALARGAQVNCGAADPQCLLLSPNLLREVDLVFWNARFDGDTMIYAEGQGGTATGDVFAWRPGWTSPRKIAAKTGVGCTASRGSTSVLCLQNAAFDATETIASVDLHAGVLGGPAGGELPFVDSFIYAKVGDAATDFSRYGWMISPDGKYVAWSGRYDLSPLERLKVQKIGDDASRVTVGDDIGGWTISRDGTTFLWLFGFNYDGSGKASGALQSAPFPAGAPTTLLGARVGDYFEAGPKGVMFRTDLAQGVGPLSVVANRDTPASVTTVDTGVRTIFDVSQDGTKVLYAKTTAVLGGSFPVSDLYLSRGGGSVPCVLSATANTFGSPTVPRLLASGSVAVYGLVTATGASDGYSASAVACTPHKFSTEIYTWQPIGDEGFVYTDDLAMLTNPDSWETSLRYVAASDGALPASGTRIQARAGLDFATLTPAIAGVVYTVNTGTASDGLYLDTSLPFKTVPPVPSP